MQSRTFHFRVRDWFPPDDPVAVLIVQLCILREDYFLELQGSLSGSTTISDHGLAGGHRLGNLDGNSVEWRRVYFFRKSIGTLYEISDQLKRFYRDRKRRQRIEDEGASFKKALEKLRLALSGAERHIAKLRQNSGGHIPWEAARSALQNVSPEYKSMMQAGNPRGKTHYKFATDIVLRMMVPEAEENELLSKIEAVVVDTAPLISVWGAIDDLVSIYLSDRRLSPS